MSGDLCVSCDRRAGVCPALLTPAARPQLNAWAQAAYRRGRGPSAAREGSARLSPLLRPGTGVRSAMPAAGSCAEAVPPPLHCTASAHRLTDTHMLTEGTLARPPPDCVMKRVET
eukprot:COSAG01_NODE_2926_length_6839_cov_5.363353_5_plen_115_part_00